MNRKKKRIKSKRKAAKLSQKAWLAFETNVPHLAKKEIQRAVKERPGNPALWIDYGLIFYLLEDDIEAERGFRSALSLIPDCQEAYQHLSTLYEKQGRFEQAKRYRETPQRESEGNSLKPLDTGGLQMSVEHAKDEQSQIVKSNALRPLSRINKINWEQIATELRQKGGVTIPALLTPKECQILISMEKKTDLFEHTVVMDSQGSGVYHFFQRPLPLLLYRVRTSFYEKLAPIANQWNTDLQKNFQYPGSLSDFLSYCHQEGQQKTTPVLFRYDTGGYNRLHRDIWGRIYFPFQLAITLSPRQTRRKEEGFSGGEFLLVDEGPGRKAKQTQYATDQGDAVIFCTHGRLIRFGGGYALQSVQHGVTPVLSGVRYAVGLPFHEYK